MSSNSTPGHNTKQSEIIEEKDNREEWEVQRDSLKIEGDEFYKAKNYKQAISKYSEAIALDPENHILYSNRSAAHLNNSEKSKSLKDAQKCVELKKDWYKGQNRLGAALFSLGRLNEARSVYMKSIKLQSEKKNPMAQKAINDIKAIEQKKVEQFKKERGMALAATSESGDSNLPNISLPPDKVPPKENPSIFQSSSQEFEGDDLLGDFFSSVENENKEEPETKENDVVIPSVSKIKIENVDLGTASDQISRVLGSNYQWKNLNPYSTLAISHEATEDEVARRYKALSLLLHPDKCRESQAQEAFEEIRKANAILKDDDRRKHIRDLIQTGMKSGRKEWEIERKRLVMKGLHPQRSLEEAQRKAVMKIFADIEMKRRDVERRKRNHEQRERDQEDVETDKVKREIEFDKNWKGGERLNNRVGNWRDFQGDPNKRRKN